MLEGLLIQKPTHQDHNNTQTQRSPGAERSTTAFQHQGLSAGSSAEVYKEKKSPDSPHKYAAEGFGNVPEVVAMGQGSDCHGPVPTMCPFAPYWTVQGGDAVPVYSHLGIWDVTITSKQRAASAAHGKTDTEFNYGSI